MPVLMLENIGHDFKGLQVLSGVHLQVKRGERHAVIGPNGAGKTTLFNVISGALKPRKGRILFKDRDVTRHRPSRLVRMGMGRSFQITSTFGRLTTFQNVRIAVLAANGIRFNCFRNLDRMHHISDETDVFLHRIGLSAERDLPVGLLSYGKHRCLEVGMAMAADPDLVLLDEPTAGMSGEESRQMVAMIRDLTRGRSMMIIEHDLDVVFSIADRITVLHRGAVLSCGTPDEIRNDPLVKEAYLGELDGIHAA